MPPLSLAVLLCAAVFSGWRSPPAVSVEPAASTVLELRSELRELRSEIRDRQPKEGPRPAPSAPTPVAGVSFWPRSWLDFCLGFCTAVLVGGVWRVVTFVRWFVAELRITSHRARYVAGTPLRLH